MLNFLKQIFMAKKTKSKTSPKGGNRGCLCDNGTYSKECCNGDLQNQGIGSTIQGGSSTEQVLMEQEQNPTKEVKILYKNITKNNINCFNNK